MAWRIKRKKAPADPELIPTKFSHTIDSKRRRLRELNPEAKLVAALTKALAIQGKSDKKNYYVAGDQIWCPGINVSDVQGTKSYKASGRFQIGKVGAELTFGMIEFDIQFRDAEDSMGLPDLIIEDANMNELAIGSSLKP